MSAVVVIVLIVVGGFAALAAALVYIADRDEGCEHDIDCGDVR